MSKTTKAQQKATAKYKKLHTVQKVVVFIREDEKNLLSIFNEYLNKNGLSFSNEIKRLILNESINQGLVSKELVETLIDKWDNQ